MEKIVYLFGAGFSAPLGLPLVSNFRFKSQDMFLENPERFAHFQEVFDTVENMSIGKNYYEADLFNIEEILSTLEMGEYLEGRRLKDVFIQYIIDVIQHFTPPLMPYPDGRLPGNWTDWLFGSDQTWSAFAYFVSNLLNLRFVFQGSFTGNSKDIICADDPNPRASYSVITLNYDMIPEMICDYCNEHYQTTPQKISFAQNDEDSKVTHNRHGAVWLSKLHGSVDSGVIVPPTWSKGVNQEIVPSWKVAYKLLAEATQVRIIGYSLPVADAYVKYLFKSAGTQNRYLKRIDVICLDGDGSVRQRYNDFIKFRAYRFADASTTDYLSANRKKYENSWSSYNQELGFVLNRLEEAHEEFMSAHK